MTEHVVELIVGIAAIWFSCRLYFVREKTSSMMFVSGTFFGIGIIDLIECSAYFAVKLFEYILTRFL